MPRKSGNEPKTETCNLRLPVAAKRALEELARREGETLSSIVGRILAAYLATANGEQLPPESIVTPSSEAYSRTLQSALKDSIDDFASRIFSDGYRAGLSGRALGLRPKRRKGK